MTKGEIIDTLNDMLKSGDPETVISIIKNWADEAEEDLLWM